MTRKHFDTLFAAGSLFCVSLPRTTPTEHATATYRLRVRRPHAPHVLSLDLWVGFGNGSKHAGSAVPSTDPREAVPSTDPTRSGRAVRDGWQPIALLNRDSMSAVFVTRSVNDMRANAHVAACLESAGYDAQGLCPVFVSGAVETPTTLAGNLVPRSAQHRNTDANKATHRAKARERGNALMAFGARKRKGG